MENRSPYVLIGAAVMVFIASIIGFVVWKLRAGDTTAYAYYTILFSGDVQGLTPGSTVFYRGLRVGRVQAVSLTSRSEVQRSTGRERLAEKIEVTVAIEATINIRERSYAVFEKPFMAGGAYIQVVGRLEDDQIKPKKKLGETPYPEIREGASFLQAASTSASELLGKASTTIDRLNELLSPDNVTSVSETLRNLATVSNALAKQDAAIQASISELPAAIAEIRKTFDKLNSLSEQVALIATELGPQDETTRKALAGRQPSEIAQTVADARKALASINGAAGELNKMLGESKTPVRQFIETGLSELSLAVRELRQLTANLSVLATKLERDPAGFVFSGKHGYSPK
jgi:phospholipid/cholesterol/gamma-HCH transport system substrate-binding protein